MLSAEAVDEYPGHLEAAVIVFSNLDRVVFPTFTAWDARAEFSTDGDQTVIDFAPPERFSNPVEFWLAGLNPRASTHIIGAHERRFNVPTDELGERLHIVAIRGRNPSYMFPLGAPSRPLR